MSIAVLMILGGFAVLNYRTCRDVRYPPFIMSALWFLAMIVYDLAPIKINQIGLLTVLILVATIIAFSGGAQLALAFHGRNSTIQEMRSSLLARPSTHPRLKKFFLICTAATLPLMVERAFQLALESGYDNFLIGLRTELLASDTGGYGRLGYIAMLSFFTTFLYAIEPRTGLGEKLQSYLSLAISLAYAVLSTGRSTIFFILAVLVGIALMQGRFNFKGLMISALVFLLSFGFFAVATLKGGDPDAPWSENISTIGESLLIYDVGPLPAFDQVVRKDAPLKYGKNTFLGPLNVIRKLGGESLVSRLREEVHVPFPTNVYTGLNAPYQDFGIGGVVLVFLMIGAASTYFYLAGLTGDPLWIFCYGVALYPLLLVTFSDEYFDPMNVWVMYGLAAYLYFRTGKERAITVSQAA